MSNATKRIRGSWFRHYGFTVLMVGSLALTGCGDVNIDGPNLCDNDGFCEPSGTEYRAEESFEIRAPAEPELSLVGMAGSVEILGISPAGEVVVEGTREVRSHSITDARDGLVELQVDVRESGETLFVETRQPSRGQSRAYLVHYRISVPEGVAVTLDHGAGPVEVRSVRADVEVQAAAGSITLEDLHGNVHAALAAGTVDVSTEVQPGGVVELGTGAGEIRLRIPRSTSAWLEATSATGQVHVFDLSVNDMDPRASAVRGRLGGGEGTIRVHTAAGNITISGNG